MARMQKQIHSYERKQNLLPNVGVLDVEGGVLLLPKFMLIGAAPEPNEKPTGAAADVLVLALVLVLAGAVEPNVNEPVCRKKSKDIRRKKTRRRMPPQNSSGRAIKNKTIIKKNTIQFKTIKQQEKK